MSDKDISGKFSNSPSVTENAAPGNNNNIQEHQILQLTGELAKITQKNEENKLRIGSLEEKQKIVEETHKRVQEYISNLNEDLATIGCMRWFVVFLSLIYIIILNAFMFCVVFYHKTYFFLFHSYTESAFFIIIISSSTFLLAAFLRGTFKTYADRHKENKTLEELQTIVKAVITKDNG